MFSAADGAGASDAAGVAIRQAVAEATAAVSLAVEHHRDHSAVAQAAQAVKVASEVVAALGGEILLSSRRVRSQAAAFRGRSRELIEAALRAQRKP